jgi:hypothetical protein
MGELLKKLDGNKRVLIICIISLDFSIIMLVFRNDCKMIETIAAIKKIFDSFIIIFILILYDIARKKK